MVSEPLVAVPAKQRQPRPPSEATKCSHVHLDARQFPRLLPLSRKPLVSTAQIRVRKDRRSRAAGTELHRHRGYHPRRKATQASPGNATEDLAAAAPDVRPTEGVLAEGTGSEMNQGPRAAGRGLGVANTRADM